jgi:hypothetical protein
VSGGVSVRAEFAYVGSDGRWSSVHVELGWFADDPHAISLWFVRQDRLWSCGRELLFDALTSDGAGEGDVRFRRSERVGYVAMVLEPPRGYAEFLVPREALVDLLVLSEPLFRPAVDAWQASLADEWRTEVGS